MIVPALKRSTGSCERLHTGDRIHFLQAACLCYDASWECVGPGGSAWNSPSKLKVSSFIPSPPCPGTALRKNRPLVPRSNSRTTFFLPRH